MSEPSSSHHRVAGPVPHIDFSVQSTILQLDWGRIPSAVSLLNRFPYRDECDICREIKTLSCCLNPIPHLICTTCARNVLFCPQCRIYPVFHTPLQVLCINPEKTRVIASFETGHLIDFDMRLLKSSTFWKQKIAQHLIFMEQKKGLIHFFKAFPDWLCCRYGGDAVQEEEEEEEEEQQQPQEEEKKEEEEEDAQEERVVHMQSMNEVGMPPLVTVAARAAAAATATVEAIANRRMDLEQVQAPEAQALRRPRDCMFHRYRPSPLFFDNSR